MNKIVIPRNSILTGASALVYHGVLKSDNQKIITIEMKKGTNPSSYQNKYLVNTQSEQTLNVGVLTISQDYKVYSKERLFIELDKFNITKEEFDDANKKLIASINKGILKDLILKLKSKRRGINWKRVEALLKLDNTKDIMALKRLLKEMVFSASKIEIPTLTFLDTEKVIENLPTGNLRPLDIEVIISLKKSFEKVIESKDPFGIKFWKDINHEIAKGSTERAGSFRTAEVRIQGTTYIPPIWKTREIKEFLEKIFNIQNKRQRVATFIAEAIKAQFFYDGNKRTSLVVGCKMLIDESEGLIEVFESYRDIFLELLKRYYESEDNKNDLVDFLILCMFKNEQEQINNLKLMKEKYRKN